MTRDQLQACTKAKLIELARQQKIAGWHGMRKDELIAVLEKRQALSSRDAKPRTARTEHPVQTAAARDTSANAEESVERSKYDVGVPTRDLSAKVPKDLPAGYGKDRIVVMVRDPYWLHCYWELTRHAIQRAEAALGPGMALGQADPPRARREQPRHHQFVRVPPPRHRHPRRLQQLVHRRQQPAAFLPHRHRLPGHAAAGSTSWPVPTSSPRPGPASAT